MLVPPQTFGPWPRLSPPKARCIHCYATTILGRRNWSWWFETSIGIETRLRRDCASVRPDGWRRGTRTHTIDWPDVPRHRRPHRCNCCYALLRYRSEWLDPNVDPFAAPTLTHVQEPSWGRPRVERREVHSICFSCGFYVCISCLGPPLTPRVPHIADPLVLPGHARSCTFCQLYYAEMLHAPDGSEDADGLAYTGWRLLPEARGYFDPRRQFAWIESPSVLAIRWQAEMGAASGRHARNLAPSLRSQIRRGLSPYIPPSPPHSADSLIESPLKGP